MGRWWREWALVLLCALLVAGCAPGRAEKPLYAYLGADMKTAHVGLGISDADFDAVAEDLVASLDKFNVAALDKDELLAILGRMRVDIVEKKP